MTFGMEIEEKWETIPSFPKYEASNLGKIRNKKNKNILKAKLDRYGYLTVCLQGDSAEKHKKVHALVAESFIGMRPEGMEINHKNCVKINNSVVNLEYITSRGNRIHAIINGRFKRKLSVDQILEIRRLRLLGAKTIELARKFNVSQQQISDISNRKKWSWI